MYCKEGDLLQFCLNRTKTRMANHYEVPFSFGFAMNDVETDFTDSLTITIKDNDDGNCIQRDFHRFNMLLPCDNDPRKFLRKEYIETNTDYKDRPFVETED